VFISEKSNDITLLKRFCEVIEKLKPIAEYFAKLHEKGLYREDLLNFINSVEVFLRFRLGDKAENSALLERLSKWRNIVNSLPDFLFPIHPREHANGIAGFLERLPSIRPGFIVPKAKDIAKTLREVDELIGMFIEDFRDYRAALSELFKELKPDAIRAIIDFISTNPGYARTVLGEPLFMWWFSRSLSTQSNKSYWVNARGPVTVANTEIDVVSIQCSREGCGYAIAEVKISKKLKSRDVSELTSFIEDASKQLIRAARALKDPKNIVQVAYWCKEIKTSECICREAAIATLYSINNDVQNKIKNIIETKMKNEGIKCIVEVYDINDVLNNLHRLKDKKKYREMFVTINRILETTTES